MPQRAAGTGTIGRDLERRRLEHRVSRVERVLTALNDRALSRGRTGEVPRPLHEAIRGFEQELHGVRARLRLLSSA